MRQKILKKNIKKWWKFNVERNIQIIADGGWHFNNLFSPEMISIKLKTFAHSEFSNEKFSSPDVIRQKILNREDLFGRDHKYEIVEVNEDFPKYIIDNLKHFNDYIV